MSPTISKLLKATAMALLGAGLAGGGTTSASADTVRTKCDLYNCYRVRCNDQGGDCVNTGFVEPADRGIRHQRVCDSYGGDCHWVRTFNPNHEYDDDFVY